LPAGYAERYVGKLYILRIPMEFES
jgi:hypothetical protein